MRAFLLGDACDDLVALGVIQGIVDLLCSIDAVQRWHRDIDMATGDQRRGNAAGTTAAQQGGDVQSVRVRVRQDAHLVIAQLGYVSGTRFDTQRNADVVDFLGGGDGAGFQFQVFRILARAAA